LLGDPSLRLNYGSARDDGRGADHIHVIVSEILTQRAASGLPAECKGPFDFAQGRLYGAKRRRFRMTRVEWIAERWLGLFVVLSVLCG
jgi:hypothetical protein